MSTEVFRYFIVVVRSVTVGSNATYVLDERKEENEKIVLFPNFDACLQLLSEQIGLKMKND